MMELLLALYCRTSEPESASLTSVHCGGVLEQVKAFNITEASLSGPYPLVMLRKRKAPEDDVDVDEEAEESVLSPPPSTSPRPYRSLMVLASSQSEFLQSLAKEREKVEPQGCDI